MDEHCSAPKAGCISTSSTNLGRDPWAFMSSALLASVMGFCSEVFSMDLQEVLPFCNIAKIWVSDSINGEQHLMSRHKGDIIKISVVRYFVAKHIKNWTLMVEIRKNLSVRFVFPTHNTQECKEVWEAEGERRELLHHHFSLTHRLTSYFLNKTSFNKNWTSFWTFFSMLGVCCSDSELLRSSLIAESFDTDIRAELLRALQWSCGVRQEWL